MTANPPDPRHDEGALELLVLAGEKVDVHPLPRGGSVSLGRALENDVRVNHPSVSRRHAVLHVGPPLRIEDLGGANGSFLHEPRESTPAGTTAALRRLSTRPVEIAVGVRVMLGSVMIVVRRREALARGAPEDAPRGVVVRSPAMIALHEQARLAAQSRISVLLLGETGVGKEVLARDIHAASPRAAMPFVGLNCAALSESLLEAELFGHEKGAFTGAVQAKEGLLESADGGTIFFDEVGEMPMSIQVKLLRALEERQVLRVGGRAPRPIDVRVIAATHRHLKAEIALGNFREDLYFRLNAMTLTIPPLRERVDEIVPLARMFAARFCADLDRARVPNLSPEALSLLEGHAWRGNVRELRNAIERAVVLCSGDVIEPEHLPPNLVRPTEPISALSPAPSPPPPPSPGVEADSGERARVIAALEACAWNQTQAAAKLGITRRRLIGLIETYNLPRPRKRD